MKRVEDTGEEVNRVRQGSKVQEGQTPCCSKEAAEAPDAEKSHTTLLPFIPAVDLSIDQDEHHSAGEHKDDQERHVGEIVSQQGLWGGFHPAHPIRVGDVIAWHQLSLSINVSYSS